MQILPLLLLASAALAPVQDSKARAELFVRPAPGGNPGQVQAAIRIRIDPAWHLYHSELGQPDSVGKPTTVSLGGPAATWTEVRFPVPHESPQPGIGEGGRDTWIWTHEGTIVLFAAGLLDEADAISGVSARLRGLTCQDDGSCIPWSADPKSAGAGSADLFASFPADLKPPSPGPIEETGSAAQPAQEAGGASGAPAEEPLPELSELLNEDLLGGGGGGVEKARAKLYTRREGDVIRAAIEIEISFGWHLYHTELGQPDSVGKPTVVTLLGDGVEWAGEVVFPEPQRYEQPGVGEGARDTWIWGHEGKIVLYGAGRVTEGAQVGKLSAKIKGLTCQDDGSCIPYGQTTSSKGAGADALFAAFPAATLAKLLEGPRSLGSGGPDAGDTSPPALGGTEGTIDWAGVTYPQYEARGESEQRNLPLWLLFAFIAGIILNVMPCVLPVVSIKILSFVQQAGESRSRIFQLGLAFSAGIVAIFLALAALAIFANKGWGEQFQNQTFLVVMIGIVFAFSLSLFDVFEIGVPQAVGQMGSGQREGMVDAFFKGMMATVLATPCSGPFLGSTLAWALGQPPTIIFLIFLFVGLGMAAPYVVLTANPGFLKYVPRPGPWMQTFKHLMGFLLLGTVIFLMVSLREDLHLYTVALMVFIALACWIWGRFATFDQSTPKRIGTFVSALLVIAVGAQISFVTLRNFFAGPGAGESHLVWEDFDPVKLQRYHDEGRPVFLDFTADWCLTCKTNEKLVYESDTIVAKLDEKGVVAMRADETDDSEKTAAIKRLREQLGARSIPFMAVFPGDEWQSPYTLKDLVTTGQVSEILDSLP